MAFRNSLIHRKYLLPLLLTVSVFFISQGIYLPNFSTLHQASLCKVRQAKPRSLVVVKDHVKSPQTRVVKSAPDFDLGRKVGVISHQSFELSAFNLEGHPAVSFLHCTVPARAPPA